jgi:hypothetical protein
MTCLTDNVPLARTPLFALCRLGTPSSREQGGKLLRWVGFGKGMIGSAIALTLWAVARPAMTLVTKGSLLSIAMKSGLALGVVLLTTQLVRLRLRALAERRPWVTLSSMRQVEALSQAREARLSPALLDLIEEVSAAPDDLDASLDDPRNEALRAPLNRLAVCRWDVLAELLSPGCIIPDAVLTAYDRAAVPLMRSTFNLDDPSPTSASRHAAIDQVTERTTRLVEKTQELLDAQAHRRAHAQSTAHANRAAIADAITDAISDMTGDHFEEGMAQLDALIESDQELGA